MKGGSQFWVWTFLMLANSQYHSSRRVWLPEAHGWLDFHLNRMKHIRFLHNFTRSFLKVYFLLQRKLIASSREVASKFPILPNVDSQLFVKPTNREVCNDTWARQATLEEDGDQMLIHSLVSTFRMQHFLSCRLGHNGRVWQRFTTDEKFHLAA